MSRIPGNTLILAGCLCLWIGVWGSGTVAAKENFKRVVLDPGHGGKDPGSLGHHLVEKHLTLDLTKRVQRLLNEKGIATELTRNSDQFVSLEDRARIANRFSDAIFVSLHFNAHTDPTIRGVETMHWPGSVAGRELATSIQHHLARRVVTRNRGSKPERLKVLELTQRTAVLIECGFISHRWESQRCGAEWFRQILAEEIVAGILAYRSDR